MDENLSVGTGIAFSCGLTSYCIESSNEKLICIKFQCILSYFFSGESESKLWGSKKCRNPIKIQQAPYCSCTATNKQA